MKSILFLFSVLCTQSIFASNQVAFPLDINCTPWGYASKGEVLHHFTLKIDKDGNYQANEEWAVPGTYSHLGKAFMNKAGEGWIKVELLQEDTYFPKTRGFIRLQISPPNESFVTQYRALFSNDESAYLWESKKIICTVN